VPPIRDSETSRLFRHLRVSGLCASALAGLVASPALADCVADASGTTVTCTGTSPSYTNTLTGVSLDSQASGTVTGPVTLGDSATLTNEGTINGSSGTAAITVGTNSSVTNAVGGTISQSYSTAGSSGVVLGDYSTLTNTGKLTAVAGTNVATFGKGGTFINTASAPAAVVGNVVYGLNINGDVATFVNQNTSFGFTGNVSASGNLHIDNAGIFGGNIIQIATGGSVQFTNEAAGTFTGAFTTGDPTVLDNAGTMTLTGSSAIGTYGAAGTMLTNSGTLKVGSSAQPAELNIGGDFVQTSSGTLGITVRAAGSSGPVAGSTFSQVYASGTATLGGTLALNVTPAYYPTGSTYNVVVGEHGVTGNFSSVTGNQLTFITFVPVGVVTINGTQQAYQLQVERTTTYAQAIASVATTNQLAIATAIQPLVATADATPTGDAAALVGGLDVLDVAGAQTFFDTLSPAGYLAYASAMRDQANQLQRRVALRMTDHNSDRDQTGWWADLAIAPFGKAARGTDKTRETGFSIAGGYDLSGTNYVLGGAFGYSRDRLGYGLLNMVGHQNAYMLDLYGAYHLGPMVLSGQVIGQIGNLTATKTITIGTLSRIASASTKGKLLTGTLTLSTALKAGGFTLTPFVGIEGQKGSLNPFTESGAGAADLSVYRIKADRNDILAGATLARSTGTLRPYFKGTYRSQIGSGAGSTVTAYINDDTATLFSVDGRPAARHEFDVDAGINFVFDDAGGPFIGYQGTYRNDMTNHAIMAGVRLLF
jgi:uncharacterized protein with beta-barrel porin domain